MSGKRGMKWGKNKMKYSLTVTEALAKNQNRVEKLLDDLYELATDDKASRKEKMEALKFLIEKATPKASGESSAQGLILTADDLELMNRMTEKLIKERSETAC